MSHEAARGPRETARDHDDDFDLADVNEGLRGPARDEYGLAACRTAATSTVRERARATIASKPSDAT
jgi:hypothetical protein